MLDGARVERADASGEIRIHSSAFPVETSKRIDNKMQKKSLSLDETVPLLYRDLLVGER